MRAITTSKSNARYELEGAATLPAQRGIAAGPEGLVEAGDPCYHSPFIATVWEPDQAERAALATGRNIELVLLTTNLPPVAVGVTDEGPTDAPPQRSIEAPCIWVEIPPDLARDLVHIITTLERRVVMEGAPIPAELEAQVARLGGMRANLDRCLEALDTPTPDTDA